MQARNSIIQRHPRLNKLLVSSLMFLAFFVVAELAFRAIRFLVKGPDVDLALTVPDAELGWRLNTHRERTTKMNKRGESVIVEEYGHPHLVKKPRFHNDTRVLFPGDSFTHAH